MKGGDKMKQTKIIAGFPGVGKTELAKNTNLMIMDSDSSAFSWIEKGVRHPNFPNNYIEHIKENIGNVDYILVSSHDVVRNALKENKINYTIVYPKRTLKDEYVHRYMKRNNDEKFINFINANWADFIKDIKDDKFPKHVELESNEFLSDIIKSI